MEEYKTRVEISSDLLILLNDFIEEQKAKGIKGVTKIKVLEELCKSGLAYQKQAESITGSENNIAGVKQPDSSYPTEYIPEKKSELKAMQEALIEKERRLIEKEKFLLKKESIINKKHHDAIQYYEKKLYQPVDPTKSFTEKMKLDDQLYKLKDGHKDISNDIRSLKMDLLKILREIKSNTEVDIVHDRILPWLTATGVSANAFKNFNMDEMVKNRTNNLSKTNKGKDKNIPKQGDANTKKQEG